MTAEKRDFYGKEVTDAIKKACEELGVPQEQLEIEVVETGSTGIFGLIRKKARIKAYVKEEEKPTAKKKARAEKKPKAEKKAPEAPPEETQVAETEPVVEETEKVEPVGEETIEVAASTDSAAPADEEQNDIDLEDDATEEAEEVEELSEEALNIIKEELSQLLEHMGYPSSVEVSGEGSSVLCHVGDEYQDVLTGQEGKTLDSIQYLLRKIIAKKVPNRLRLSVDVGNYREQRLDELKIRAAELAEQVKATGKTQVIAALSPSERRIIHMSLQDDKEIRSRSVGDGLFKKILIYKPGKGSKSGGKKRNNSRGRRGGNNRRKND